jgi:uncharacterized protein (UPF0335 family)
MTLRYAVIQQIIALARFPHARYRLDVEKELRDHLDDVEEEARSQGHDEAMIERIVAIRFGDPRKIAAAFASVYALERWMRRAVACAILILASIIAASLVIGTMQSSAALLIGVPFADVTNGFYWEGLGLVAVALGYCSAYLGHRLFPTSFSKATSLSFILAICVAAGLFSALPAHALLPCVAFTCAASARLLQRVHLPIVWLAGTAGPITIMGLAFHPLLAGQGPPLWLLWVGLTLSCAVLRRIVYLFEKLAFERIHA